MSLVNIRAKIKSKLDERKGTSQPLVEVYQEHRTDFGGYPVATFEPSDIESDYETNTQNYRNYIFRIVLHQEIEKIGKDQAIGILSSLVDTLIQDFEEDWSLGGVVDQCNAIPLNFGLYDEGAGKVLYAEIKLECHKLISIN